MWVLEPNAKWGLLILKAHCFLANRLRNEGDQRKVIAKKNQKKTRKSLRQQKESAGCVENIVNNFAANGGKCKTLATLTNGGKAGRVYLSHQKDAK